MAMRDATARRGAAGRALKFKLNSQGVFVIHCHALPLYCTRYPYPARGRAGCGYPARVGYRYPVPGTLALSTHSRLATQGAEPSHYHSLYRGDSVLDSTRQVYNLGNGGFPVHHDPVHGIGANLGNREWGLSPFSIFGVCPNPVHGVMVNWEPSSPAGWRQVPDPTMTEHGICPGASICYIYSGIK